MVSSKCVDLEVDAHEHAHHREDALVAWLGLGIGSGMGVGIGLGLGIGLEDALVAQVLGDRVGVSLELLLGVG